jgi:serine/threonine-protein kinase
VGYYLLTGTPVFTGESVVEICLKHAKAAVEPPSARRGNAISADLERLVLRCLAKSPADRPDDGAGLLRELEACAIEGDWTAADAAAWWAERDRATRPSAQAVAATMDLALTPRHADADATTAR